MKWPRARAPAGALALFAISSVARAEPASPAQSAAPGEADVAHAGMPVMPPLTGDESELPARPPAHQSMHGGRGGPIPNDAQTSSPPPPRGPYVHDGVFLRLAVGPGLFQASTGNAPDSRSYSAGAVSIDAAIGGSPARGFVLGGAFQTHRLFSLTSSDDVLDGDEPDLSDVSFSVSGIGLFADYYPEPTDGLHFLASVGMGWLDVSRPDSSSEKNPSGVLLGLGGGYEWFIGPTVSLGVLLRGNLGLFSVSETNASTSTSVTVFIPSLLATATYN